MILLMMVYESICSYTCSNIDEETFKIGILTRLYMKIGDMGFVESTTNMVCCALEFTWIARVNL